MGIAKRKTHEATTLLASANRTATGTGDAVRLQSMVNGFAFTLNVTDTALAAGDLLDVFIQTKPDGTNWMDVVHFTQVAGNETAVRHIGKVAAEQAETTFDASAALAAGSSGDGQVCYYCNFQGAVNAMAYRHTRTPAHLKYAEYQVATMQEIFAAYKRLPAREVLVPHFTKRLFTYSRAASPEFQYLFRDVRARTTSRRPPVLSFAIETAGTPYVALPMAVWALQGYPDPTQQR